MRPVSAEYRISQGFGSMKTQGVAANPNPNSGAGYYVHLYGNYQPYGHAGCDIACPEGTPVRAIAAGTVLWADWGTKLPGDDTNFGYRRRWYLYKSFPGIVTVIQHPGWIGVYAHLSEARMNTGDRVTEGQVIGLSGGTGGVAPHLHVEALVDLTYRTSGGLIYGRTDPEPYFGGIAAMGSTHPASEEDDDMFTQAEKDALFNALARIDQKANTLPGPTYWADMINAQARIDAFAAAGTDPAKIAAAIADALPAVDAAAVVDALAARLGGTK